MIRFFMGKIFNNKFFVLFVAISFFFYFGVVHVAYAGGAVSTIINVVIIALVVFQPELIAFMSFSPTTLLVATAAGLVANALFPCNPIVGFVVGAAAGAGANSALETGMGPGLITGSGGCGGSGAPAAAQQGTPNSPVLVNQTATPIVQGYCTTGFNLSYDVTDAYQYAIYRDGSLINQGVLQNYPATPAQDNPDDRPIDQGGD